MAGCRDEFKPNCGTESYYKLHRGIVLKEPSETGVFAASEFTDEGVHPTSNPSRSTQEENGCPGCGNN